MKKITDIARFLYEAGSLRKIVRAHRHTLLHDDLSDNIASHSYRVSVIGWFLAKEEKADPYKVLLMCLFHDTGEARSGDQHWVNKRYVKVFEDEILKEQYSRLPHGKDILPLIKEYEVRNTLEAQITKDADLLDQIMLLKEHAWSGNKEAEEWLEGAEQGKRLNTKTAKKIAKELMKQNPSEWWQNLWTSERR